MSMSPVEREVLPSGWSHVEVKARRTSGGTFTRWEVADLTSRLRYRDEWQSTIATKFFAIYAGLCLYFSVYIAAHAIRAFTATIYNRSPSILLRQVWTIVRAVFYFIALECIAFFGTMYPLSGRVLYGAWESALHDGKTRRDSIQYKENYSEAISSFFFGEEHKQTFFFAFCMQPIGRLDDPHIVKITYFPSQEGQNSPNA